MTKLKSTSTVEPAFDVQDKQLPLSGRPIRQWQDDKEYDAYPAQFRRIRLRCWGSEKGVHQQPKFEDWKLSPPSELMSGQRLDASKLRQIAAAFERQSF